MYLNPNNIKYLIEIAVVLFLIYYLKKINYDRKNSFVIVVMVVSVFVLINNLSFNFPVWMPKLENKVLELDEPTCPEPVCPEPVCPEPTCPEPTCPEPVCPEPVYIEPQYQDNVEPVCSDSVNKYAIKQHLNELNKLISV